MISPLSLLRLSVPRRRRERGGRSSDFGLGHPTLGCQKIQLNCHPELLNHSMGVLLSDHNSALSAVCIGSLILGLLLMANALWHLRVSSNASGRGVLRLLKRQYCINLLGIPAILIELAILAMPTKSMPTLVCLYLEWTVGFVRANHYLGGLGIALSR